MAHSHHHEHTNDVENFNLAFAIAVTLNFIFVIVEAIYAISANSMSLLADAGHNLGDVLGLAMAWGANWLLTKPATERYSYGFKRTSILAAIFNALILVFTSGIIAYESINKLITPEKVHEMTVIIVALIGIFINGGTALLFMKGRKNDLNIQGAFLHLAYDSLISFGVVITGVIILITNSLWLDPVVGLLIVVAILVGTWGLLRNSVNLILDAVPHNIDQKGVEQYLKSLPHVKTVHDLHIWGLSTKEVAITVHLVMDEKALTNIDYHSIQEHLKKQFRINHCTIQIEKDNDECHLETCVDNGLTK